MEETVKLQKLTYSNNTENAIVDYDSNIVVRSFSSGVNENIISGCSSETTSNILPTYNFDECCKEFKMVAGFSDFHVIKDKDGNTCMALAETIKDPVKCYSRRWLPGIVHIKEYIPVKEIFAICKSK